MIRETSTLFIFLKMQPWEIARERYDSCWFPREKSRRSVEKFTVKRPWKQRYFAYGAKRVRVCAPCNRKEREARGERGRRRGRETSREGTSERQRGSRGGELVGLAVCCPMTEFIASFAFAPKSRSFDVIGWVARRDSLFHWKLPEKEIEKAVYRKGYRVV